MKKRKVLGIISIALMFGIMVIGCEGVTEDPSSSASLTGVTVAGVKVTDLGSPNVKWAQAVAGEVYLTDDKLANAQVLVSTSGDGAFVYYAATGNTGVPDFVEESTFDLLGIPYLYIEVFSPNKDAVLFYKIHVNVATPKVSSLSFVSSLWVDAKGNVVERPVTLGTPGATPDAAVASTLSVGASKLPADISITANVEQPLTVLQYAVTANATAVPSFSDADEAYQNVSVNDGSVVYVEGTGSDGATQLFYKVNIASVGDTITGLTIGGVTPTSLGTPGDIVESFGMVTYGGTAGAITLTTAQASGSVTVTASGIPAGAAVRYALGLGVDSKGNVTADLPSAWNTNGVFAGGLTNGIPVFVEVTPAGGAQVNLYKINVTVAD